MNLKITGVLLSASMGAPPRHEGLFILWYTEEYQAV